MPLPASIQITALFFAMVLPVVYGSELQDVPEVQEPKVRKIPAISVLPDGSELEGVVLPRYDQELRLTGSLRADKLTLVSPEKIQGDNILITMIDPARPDIPTQITLGSAVLDQVRRIVRAEEDVTIHSARFTATGTALHLAFEEGRGYVSGPASTVILAPPKTAMHMPVNSHHPRLATVALGVVVATSAMVQARPPAVSADELAGLHRDAASIAAKVETQNKESSEGVAATAKLSGEISEAARTFLINQVLDPGEAPPATPDREEAKPLEIEATPEDTRILSDGGFYFDAEEGILVYLENVRVLDSRFTLDGVDELKIIFAEKPESKTVEGNPKSEDDGPASGFAAGVGEIERIIATGRVRFNQRQTQDRKPPVEASGALFNYDVAKGEIILSGGYPWVRQGGYYARALQPDLNLRIRRDGSFVTEGNWDTGQNIRR